MPLSILPSEVRQSFTHDVDHGLRCPAISAIVEEREGQDLTIYRRNVPSQRNNVVGGARFGVEVPLSGGVPHPTSEQLGVSSHRQGRMEPRTPGSAGGVAQQMALCARGPPVEGRKPPTVGQDTAPRV